MNKRKLLTDRVAVGAMKIIHINRNIIQQNAKHNRQEPVVRVEEGGKVKYCMEVIIDGPSRMVYRPEAPRPCGAKLWIETDAPLTLVGEGNQKGVGGS